jgi:hypothetical protein
MTSRRSGALMSGQGRRRRHRSGAGRSLGGAQAGDLRRHRVGHGLVRRDRGMPVFTVGRALRLERQVMDLVVASRPQRLDLASSRVGAAPSMLTS